MSYQVSRVSQLPYLAEAWVEYENFSTLLKNLKAQPFQTQQARQRALDLFNTFSKVPMKNVRFPAGKWYVWYYSPELSESFKLLMKAADTRNRILETEGQSSRPSGAEVETATRRVDDSTVAIREALDDLERQILFANGVYDRETFESESGLNWQEVVAAARSS
uniref:Capsid protein n=1 Tax=Jand tobamovirus 1 TaxID=3238876 RepID=A0AB39BZS8_9VIRU